MTANVSEPRTSALRSPATVAFQPIVALSTGTTVGFEALARGLGGSADPLDVLFERAISGGRISDLDWSCRLNALEAALAAHLGRELTLFINVEPATPSDAPIPPQVTEILQQAARDLRVFIEVTERALLQHPANVLSLARWARSLGWGVALDDVGANPGPLALLPFVAPDVVKLDLGLIQHDPSPNDARTITAILAHAERHGTTLLAEGIETTRHEEQARSLGATLGQGWLYGRPGPLPGTERE